MHIVNNSKSTLVQKQAFGPQNGHIRGTNFGKSVDFCCILTLKINIVTLKYSNQLSNLFLPIPFIFQKTKKSRKLNLIGQKFEKLNTTKRPTIQPPYHLTNNPITQPPTQ